MPLPDKPTLQMAFVTTRLPIAARSLEIPKSIMLGGAAAGPVPFKVPVTLVHVWICGTQGKYDFAFDVYAPNGRRMGLSNQEAIVGQFTNDGIPTFICYHDVDLLVEGSGPFEIEVLCDEEVVLRYPFMMMVSS